MPVNKALQIPVNVVGSSVFGRYPKISLEKTYNMFVSDEWLVNFAGYKNVCEIASNNVGRGMFHSIRGNFIIAVFGSAVYKIGTNLAPQFIQNIDTLTGEVFIDENLNRQICIVDGQDAWIYNYDDNTFTKQTLLSLTGDTIIPNYVSYHNSFFLIAGGPLSINPQIWYAFEFSSNTTIVVNSEFALQTKPDNALAVKRIPGRGNNVLVLGSSVAEIWTQVGGAQNYLRVQSFNIDSGVVSVSTIAASEELVCWLAQNENNSPVIMVTDGSSTRRISTDGIDYLMETIKFPNQSTAIFYRLDGHLFYQLTFFNPEDNLTLLYDFNTQMFFHLSDENLNYHPARQLVYFNEASYFVSLNDANIYQTSTDFFTYNYDIAPNTQGEEIPRIRICKTVRREDTSRFRAGRFTFWIEQGVNDYFLVNPSPFLCNGLLITQDNDFIITQDGDYMLAQDGICPTIDTMPRVDMSVSKNGNQSFSNVVSKILNPAGKYRNQIQWWRMGQANEFTIQLRFWGFQRFVVQNGVLEVIP